MFDLPTKNTAAGLFENAMSLARGRALSIADLISTADRLQAEGSSARVLELYRTWLAFNGDDPLAHAISFNHSIALGNAGDKAGAVLALRDVITRAPDFGPAYINLGGTYDSLGQLDQAVLTWRAFATRFDGISGEGVHHMCLALNQMGRVLEQAQMDPTAEAALRRSLEFDPTQVEAIQHWLSLRQRQCIWPLVQPFNEVSVTRLMSGMSPLTAACYSDDPVFLLAKARAYNKRSIGYPENAKPFRHTPPAVKGEKRKLRIGYVSSDFREHAVGFSMTDLIETHDREAVDVYTYYNGVPASCSTRRRIERAADRFTDLTGLDDRTAANIIHADRIDILVDLNGYTKDARTKVFGLRPAPINVNWFGFPGTMGSAYHHYLIADAEIVPPEAEIYYSEKIARLPCYQPNDRKRAVAPVPPRAQENLPDDAFVFCCLNGMQKVTQATFVDWMRILHAVPNSVLWLLSGTEGTDDRLRTAATSAGIAPERLVFAQKKANPEHVARYALADLFLDTFPYGAHTTAADSLWMGVPILTMRGKSFAARVCASLVTAAGIPELVCSSREDYVARAIALARDPVALAELKRRLRDGRDTSLLFDTPRLARELEALYRGMWADFEEGRLPRPDLANLDLYDEIGNARDHVGVLEESEADMLAAYRERLGARDAFEPLPNDTRLWSR